MTNLIKEKNYFSFFVQFFFIFILVILTFNYISKISAKEDEEYSKRFLEIANKLRCPSCQGLSVKDSEAGFSNIIKEKIVEMIRIGKSDEEIINFFVKRYGEWIMREPSRKGFNLILWALPGFGIFAGLYWVFFRFKFRNNNTKDKKFKKLTPEEESKIKKDLKVFEEG